MGHENVDVSLLVPFLSQLKFLSLELLKTMFPDSQVAKSFRLSKTKCSYYLVFELAVYFKETLIESIKSSPSYSVSFDESLNHHLQEEQMNVQVRYWDPETVQTVARYLDSRFFCRLNANKIQEELHEGLKPLDEKAMIMLSMDGPNTNWAALNKVKDRNKNELPQIMDVVSCGLHVVHGAFKNGVNATGSQLEKILKAMWKLFNDLLSRRDLYIKLNQTAGFPLVYGRQSCNGRMEECC